VRERRWLFRETAAGISEEQTRPVSGESRRDEGEPGLDRSAGSEKVGGDGNFDYTPATSQTTTWRQQMSHLGLVDLVVQDVDDLAEAGQPLGFRLQRRDTYKWYGRIVGDSQAYQAALAKGFKQSDFGRCEYVLSTNDPNAYEIGVVRNPDGNGYSLLYDSWGPGAALEKLGGQGLCKLTQEYGAIVAMRELIAQGFRATRVTQENGDIQLIGCD
jgi:hypothetical protein